jgi:microcin C transport system permease protein
VLALIRDQGWLIQPPLPFSWQSIDMTLNSPAPAPPSLTHWLGTDDQGRDVLARVIYGFRLSVLFAGLVTLGSVIIGVIMGAVQGYFGGRVDLVGQRIIELWAGLPMLFILIILSSLVVPSVWWLALIMIAFSWLGLVDIVRAEFLRARNLDYVRAARAMGLPARLIMWRHVLPNAMVSTLTFLPFIFTGAITTLTALDFLGFGLPPGSPSLGELVAQGKNNLQAPWLGLTAFMTLAVLLSLLVFIGEGLRDAFDPRHAAFSMGGRTAS